jgi:hypothetical protein
MKLLVKFPTRGRKTKFLSVLKKYYDLCEDKDNTHFLISLDEDDSEMNDQHTKDVLRTYKNLTFIYDNSKSKIDAVNRDIEKFEKEWDILLLASDDMVPQIKGYDIIIKNKMSEFFPETDGILWFNDGFQGNRLNTLCILGKKYYERFNYIYHPDYKSCWSDNEFMEVGNILKKQIYIDQVIIKHEHPDWGYGSIDYVHNNNVKDWHHDNNVFQQRKSNNFYI